MKIVSDEKMIGYRISLQTKMMQEVIDFSLFIAELQERMKKFPLNHEEVEVLYEKVVTLCGLYYELAFGNYFRKKDHNFRERVYRALVSKYASIIFDASIKNMQEKVATQIIIDMENFLKEEIRKEKNGNKQ